MKYVRIVMPDGKQWDVASPVIARVYAELHEEDRARQQNIPREQAYQAIYDKIVDSEYWLGVCARELRWEHVEAYAILVNEAPIPPDYDYGWKNGRMTFVEHD